MEAEERQFDFFHFLALVPELQLLVVSHLDVEDLPSLGLVSNHFYSLTQENVLWKSMVDRKWPGATKIAGHPATRRHYTGLDKVKWHEYYIERTSFERPGSLKWVHHPTKVGAVPLTRYSHTACVVNGVIYFIGGTLHPPPLFPPVLMMEQVNMWNHNA